MKNRHVLRLLQQDTELKHSSDTGENMNDQISRLRIVPSVVVHKELPRPAHPEPQPPGRPLKSDTPGLTSIEVGGDTPPPGPSGFRDGFED
jgi:hypothetical protein